VERMGTTIALLLSAAWSALGGAPPVPVFATGPAAHTHGARVTIRFAVSVETDAEVAIVDAEGRVVRHLAAGRLGKNAPKPFRPGSLKQELTWDGKDDDGKPVGDLSKLQVRVGLGLKAELHGVIGWNGDYVDAARGIACGPDGTLYALYGGGAYLALDESQDPPVLWIAGIRYFHAGWAKLIDRGERLEAIGDVTAARLKGKPQAALGFIGDVTVAGHRLLTRHPAFGMHTNASFAYHTDTGQPLGLFTPMADGRKAENMWQLLYGEMVAGKDGNLHVADLVNRRVVAADRPCTVTKTCPIQ